MIEVCCPECGSHYRFAAPDGAPPQRFLCQACDSCFTIESQPNKVLLEDQAQQTTPPEPKPSPAPIAIANDAPIIPATEDLSPPLLSPPHRSPPHQSPQAMPAPQPRGKLWPWLLVLLLLISGIGFWLNHSRWMMAEIPLSVRAWWAPQRSLGWKIHDIHSQWVSRPQGKPLLTLSFTLENHTLFHRPPPPLLATFHTRNSHHIASPRVIVLTQQPTQQQLMQTPWIPPQEDHRKVPANGRLSYTVVFNNPPKLLKNIDLSLN